MGKPNLVKDFCPRLPLDLDLDFVLGQAFQKSHHFGPKLPYIKSGFSKNQGEFRKLKFKINPQHPRPLIVVIWKYEQFKKPSDLFLLHLRVLLFTHLTQEADFYGP